MKSDAHTTLQDLKGIVAAFVKERDWQQFHTPKNLSTDISIEAAELMEKFVWDEGQDSYKTLDAKRQEVEDEFSDVLLALLCFANACEIDINSAFRHKLAEVKAKYPVDKAKGLKVKYTEL